MDPHRITAKTWESESAAKHFRDQGNGPVLPHRILDVEREAIQRFFDKFEAVLDLGCETGRTTEYLKGAGFSVVGIDISMPMLSCSKSLCPETDFVQANASFLPFRDSMFGSYLFSFNGIDYTFPKSRREKLLAEVRRTLKHDGAFVFSSSNPVGEALTSVAMLNLRGFRKAVLAMLRGWSLTGSAAYTYYLTEDGPLFGYHGFPLLQKKLLGKHFRRVLIEPVLGTPMLPKWLNALVDAWPYYVCSSLKDPPALGGVHISR